MSNTFKSVRDLIKATSPKERVTEFDEIMKRSLVVNEMIQGRVSAGLTQKELAESMQVSQSTISKIENSADCDLTLGELVRYAGACNSTFTLRIGPPISLVQSVKEHAVAMKLDLDRLASIACENEADFEIPKKIEEFFGEACFNLMSFLVDAAEKLPRATKSKTPMLRILMREEASNPPQKKPRIKSSTRIAASC